MHGDLFSTLKLWSHSAALDQGTQYGTEVGADDLHADPAAFVDDSYQDTGHEA